MGLSLIYYEHTYLMTVLFEFIECGVKMTRRLPVWRVYERGTICQWKVYERGIFSAQNGI